MKAGIIEKIVYNAVIDELPKAKCNSGINKMKIESTSSESQKIVAHDTFITFRDEVSSIVLRNPGEDIAYNIKFAFDETPVEKIEINTTLMTGSDVGTIFTFKGASGALDGGIAEPFKFAKKETEDGKTFEYYINVWVRKMGSSRLITYTIYEKEITQP